MFDEQRADRLSEIARLRRSVSQVLPQRCRRDSGCGQHGLPPLRSRGVTVRVDPDTFADSGLGPANERIMVAEFRAAYGVVEIALARAGNRFLAVGEDGVERTGSPELGADEWVEAARGTPNWVSPVNRGSLGPWMYVDCKGVISGPMRDRFRAIVVEELAEVGVEHARLLAPAMTDVSGGPLEGLAAVRRCVSLHVYPPPLEWPKPSPHAPADPDQGIVPPSWVDAAIGWLTKALPYSSFVTNPTTPRDSIHPTPARRRLLPDHATPNVAHLWADLARRSITRSIREDRRGA